MKPELESVAISLDVGSRRIGVAWGDTKIKIASPLPAIVNDGRALEGILALVRDMQPSIIVIGLPRGNNGKETAQSDFTRQFASSLKNTLALNSLDEIELVWQDESLTSVLAEERLRQKKDFNERMLRDGTLDSEAAVIILTDFLEEAGRG